MDNYLIVMIALIYALFITIFLYITLVRKRNNEDSIVLLKAKTKELDQTLKENVKIKEECSSLKSENKIIHELLENSKKENELLNQETSKTIQNMMSTRESLYKSENECNTLSTALDEEKKDHEQSKLLIREKAEENGKLSDLFMKEKKEKEECWQKLLEEKEKNKELSVRITEISSEKEKLFQELEEEKKEKAILKIAHPESEEKERLDESLKALNEEQRKIYDAIHEFASGLEEVSIIRKDYFDSIVYQKTMKFAQLSITDGRCVIKAGIGKIESDDGKMPLYLKPIRFIVHEEEQLEKAKEIIRQSLNNLKNTKQQEKLKLNLNKENKYDHISHIV